jgi:hypothetical protein
VSTIQKVSVKSVRSLERIVRNIPVRHMEMMWGLLCPTILARKRSSRLLSFSNFLLAMISVDGPSAIAFPSLITMRDIENKVKVVRWNGAMARWNTIFVEVPIATFNPVKTIDDLLRPQHLPEE